MTKIVNPHLTVTSRNSVALSWEDSAGYRYHVWLNAGTFDYQLGAMGQPKLRAVPVIYKRVPESDPNAKMANPRYLDGSKAVNVKLLAAVRAAVDIKGTYDAAIAKMDGAALERAEKDRLAYVEDCKREAGVALYAALTGLMEGARSMGMRPDNDFYVAAKDAIKQADADTATVTAKDFV